MSIFYCVRIKSDLGAILPLGHRFQLTFWTITVYLCFWDWLP